MEQWNSYLIVSTKNTRNVTDVTHTWYPTSLHVEKINFDASFINENVMSGIRLILRNNAGECSGVRGIPKDEVDSEQTEVLGALEAVLWENERGIRNIQLEGDYMNVVKAIQAHTTTVKWTTSSIIRDILFFPFKF